MSCLYFIPYYLSCFNWWGGKHKLPGIDLWKLENREIRVKNILVLDESCAGICLVILFVCQVGELIGGSQREDRLEYLEDRLDDLKLNKESYWWYLDLRRYGSGQKFYY